MNVKGLCLHLYSISLRTLLLSLLDFYNTIFPKMLDSDLNVNLVDGRKQMIMNGVNNSDMGETDIN